MARRRFSTLRRMLIRRLDQQNDDVVAALRDQLWDVLIVRMFRRGCSVSHVAAGEPSRNTAEKVEAAIRREMRRHEGRRS